MRICTDYDYRLYSLYLLSDLSLTVDYIPHEHPKLRGTTPIGLTLDPQNNEPLIPRLRCHVAVAEYEGIEESKKTLYCTY